MAHCVDNFHRYAVNSSDSVSVAKYMA